MTQQPPQQPPKDLSLLPIAQQEALAERYQARADVRKRMDQLAATLKAWLDNDTPDFELFNALGHQAQYTEWPKDTLARQLQILGFTADEIKSMKGKKVPPADFMGATELMDALARIDQMFNYFADLPDGGTFDEACALYMRAGQLIRAQVMAKTGHAPELYMPEGARIKGTESPKRFKAKDVYRPPLF